MQYQHYINGILWDRNISTRTKHNTYNSIVKSIITRMQTFGHMKRVQQDRLPKNVYEWIHQTKRKKGWPATTWKENVQITFGKGPSLLTHWHYGTRIFIAARR